jgi:hypothetical protein
MASLDAYKMSVSNRSYLCVTCGALRRAPLPSGLIQWISEEERARQKILRGIEWPEEVTTPAPYGHWRNLVVPKGYELPTWLYHCDKPVFLLGKRASQAATQIEANERLTWITLGCRVSEHAGRKRWRPILKDVHLKNAYPLV